MKEAIGGTWLFGIVIFFIVLFATIVSVSLNWSRAYKLKDEMINEIEKHHGLTQEAKDAIDSYIGDIGYKSTGSCNKVNERNAGGVQVVSFSTGSDLNNMYRGARGDNYCVGRSDVVTREEKQFDGNSRLSYCATVEQSSDSGSTVRSIGHPSSSYYYVLVFFKIDMPIIGSIFGFDITGETSTIFNISADDHFSQLNGVKLC